MLACIPMTYILNYIAKNALEYVSSNITCYCDWTCFKYSTILHGQLQLRSGLSIV